MAAWLRRATPELRLKISSALECVDFVKFDFPNDLKSKIHFIWGGCLFCCFFFSAVFGLFWGSWFYAFLFLGFSCFSAFLVFAFPASLLFCFSVFPASLLLYFCAFLLLLFYFFFSSVMCFCCSTSCSFASLLPVFIVSLFFIFFCFILFCLYPK